MSHEEEYLRVERDKAFEYLEEKIGAKTTDCRKEKDYENKSLPKGTVYDSVKNPKHYMFFDTEAIDIIKASLSYEEFIGYLKGNALKYRLRAGKKGNAIQDLEKAEQYEKMYKDMK